MDIGYTEQKQYHMVRTKLMYQRNNHTCNDTRNAYLAESSSWYKADGLSVCKQLYLGNYFSEIIGW